jgi:hypothetical protein
MKYLVLLLILAITAQPLQAGSCDMESDHADSHSMEQMDHGSDGMPDCCDSDDEEIRADCDIQMSCAACALATPAVSGLQCTSLMSLAGFPQTISAGEITPDHSCPPFHPPIS